MQNTYPYKPSHILWLMALLAFILFSSLGATPIYILDEAKNAQCAREMLQRNDWVIPTFNGELRTDKPVLHYYFMMVSYKIFGVNEFAARFFSAVLGVLTVLLTFLFTKKFIDGATGFCSALVLVASTQFLFEFRLSVPDPYLIFFITAGLLTAYTYLQQNTFIYLLIAALSFGLATLAKGPVALALPGLCLLIWTIWKRKWKWVITWKILPAVALIAAVTLPWYLAVHTATNGAWTNGFFIDHNFNRFSDPQEGHGGFFLITLLFVLVGLLPFTSFIGEVACKRKAVFNQHLVQFSGIVILVFVGFFSIASTRLANYPMPCYPFVAIVLGHYLSKLINNEYAFKKYPLYIIWGILFIVTVAGYFAIKQEKEAAYTAWTSFLLLVGPAALLIVIALWKKLSNYRRLIGIMLAYSLFNIVALHIVYPVIYLQNPVAKNLQTVKRRKPVFAFGIYNPGYNFYLDSNVRRFHNVDSLRVALLENPSAILITRTSYADTLVTLNLKKVSQHHDLFETPTTILYVPQVQP